MGFSHKCSNRIFAKEGIITKTPKRRKTPQQEGSTEAQEEGLIVRKTQDPIFAYDMDEGFQLYEWLLNIVAVMFSEMKENKKSYSIPRTGYGELAREALLEAIADYEKSILQLNPGWTFGEILSYMRRYLYKKATGGKDKWEMEGKTS